MSSLCQQFLIVLYNALLATASTTRCPTVACSRRIAKVASQLSSVSCSVLTQSCIGIADDHRDESEWPMCCPLCNMSIPEERDTLPVRNDGSFVNCHTSECTTRSIQRAAEDDTVSDQESPKRTSSEETCSFCESRVHVYVSLHFWYPVK